MNNPNQPFNMDLGRSHISGQNNKHAKDDG